MLKVNFYFVACQLDLERREAEMRAKREEEERKRLEEALRARQEEERKRLEEEELVRQKQVENFDRINLKRFKVKQMHVFGGSGQNPQSSMFT